MKLAEKMLKVTGRKQGVEEAGIMIIGEAGK